jgi:thioredoxin reductase
MNTKKIYEVIIIGGSYAGLSAAMALGRSLRQVLIIDSNLPCNRKAPHSHNFITQDGNTPKEITEVAKQQVLKYSTVNFINDLAIRGNRTDYGFEITTLSGEVFTSKKLLFATGVVDQMLPIEGFSECWGISVVPCPYCHGYEFKNKTIGLLANGDFGFELSRLLYNWSKDLVLFTNGKSLVTKEHTEKIKSHGIKIMEKEIAVLEHTNGNIASVAFKDGTKEKVDTIFARISQQQHCTIPQELGCEITEQSFIKTDEFGKTSVPGVFVAGDNSSIFRAVSFATAAGTKAGVFINKELIEETF